MTFYSIVAYGSGIDRVLLENESGYGMFLIVLIVLFVLLIASLVSRIKH